MDIKLTELTKELERDFERWEYLRANGGSDPFWPDGMNLNLVRNHIISDKRRIRALIDEKNSEMTLFEVGYPPICDKETPPEVPNDLMVKADEIRAHAKEQLELYLADPNFQYLKAHAKEVYAQGQTRETKEADLPYYGVIGLEHYEKIVEEDDLVDMRRSFSESYKARAARWADFAEQIRAYMEGERPSPAGHSERSTEELESSCSTDEGTVEQVQPTTPEAHPSSLDDVLTDAVSRAAKQHDEATKAPSKQKEEQLSLF